MNAHRYGVAVRTTLTENDLEFNFDYDSLIAPLNIEKSRMSSLPYISGGTLREFADHTVDNHRAIDFKPEAVESGQIVFVQTEIVDHFIAQHHPKVRNPYVLLTHKSDSPSGHNQLLRYLDDPKIIAWYGQNVISRHPKLHAIPIGVPNINWADDNPFKLKAISIQLKPFYRRKILLYVNFDVGTNPNRGKTLEYFWREFGDDSTTYFAQKRFMWDDYMLQLGETKFVISPPGNGIDCYRTWEALIMGAVPIVLRSELQSLYDEMPVMVVDDWQEVTRENLLQYQLTRLNLSPDGVPRRPKIWARYWLEHLQAIRSSYKP